MRIAIRAASAVVIAAALASAGCSTPAVRTTRVGADEVYESVKQDVLLGGEPSVAARLVLERAGLLADWEEDRGAALVKLHEAAARADTRERLYGLAELSMYQGERTGSHESYLAATVYAYLYLFGKADAPPPTSFDPRFRVACDLYSRGLSEAFRDLQWNEFHPAAGVMSLPVGKLDVAVPAPTVRIGDAEFDQFFSADDFAVTGMRARVRTEGLGLALIALRRHVPEDAEISARVGRMAPRIAVPMTAVLSVDGEIGDLASGVVHANLEIRVPKETPTVDVRGQKVPLTNDVTTPIAYSLGRSKLWSFSIDAFLKGGEQKIKNGLAFMVPYEPGRIPLVLVHGTASSPATWAELVNELAADKDLTSHYQVWLFIYSTGVPILVSAESLRDSLTATIQALDPEGKDPAMKRMVIVGHSQGGLLTQLMGTSSGNAFWRNFSDDSIDSFTFEQGEAELFKSTFFFEPLPQLERVVFISTPHSGSYMAGGIIGKISSMLIHLPKKLLDETQGAVKRNYARLKGDKLGSMPTAVDNMQAGSTFLQALETLPMDPRIKVNSICAVDGDGPVEEGGDGVVAYESAHWPAAESELVVRDSHSCQGNPRTVLEIRRILHEHLRAVPPAAATPAPQPAK